MGICCCSKLSHKGDSLEQLSVLENQGNSSENMRGQLAKSKGMHDTSGTGDSFGSCFFLYYFFWSGVPFIKHLFYKGSIA